MACARLGWPSRQRLNVREYTVSYRIGFAPKITTFILSHVGSKTTIDNFGYFPPHFADCMCIVIFSSSLTHDVINLTIIGPTAVNPQVVPKVFFLSG